MRYTGIGDNPSYLYGTLQVRKFSQVISKFTMTALLKNVAVAP